MSQHTVLVNARFVSEGIAAHHRLIRCRRKVITQPASGWWGKAAP